jgi:hypothetical protein
LELERFNGALQLRWQWFKWKNPKKPWSKMTVPLSATEVELFRACTNITLGDWRHHELMARSMATRAGTERDSSDNAEIFVEKKHFVAQAVMDRKWMKGLQRISTMEEVRQFVKL